MLENERRMVEIDGQIKKLEANLKALKQEKARLTEIILDYWLEAGVNKMTIDGNTMYCHTRTFAVTPKGREAAIEILKQSEHADIVREDVNMQTLAALVRELNETTGSLPPEWEGVIEIGGEMSIKIRKS